MSEKSHVSMEQHLCLICGTKHDTGAILLQKQLKPTLERNTLTEYSNCEQCTEKIKEGYIALIEISNPPDRYQVLKPSQANRTGVLIWIRKKVAQELFSMEIATEMIFINQQTIDQLKNIMK